MPRLVSQISKKYYPPEKKVSLSYPSVIQFDPKKNTMPYATTPPTTL